MLSVCFFSGLIFFLLPPPATRKLFENVCNVGIITVRVLFYVRGFECGMHLTARAEEAGGNGFPEWRVAAEAGGAEGAIGLCQRGVRPPLYYLN